ncbi:MAG: hypothetical protein GXO66_08900 [Euryarchaeota archaeon]|nr:hypothetical protein [Euryarchaeota archaeon]
MKRLLIFITVLAALLLSGCVAPPEKPVKDSALKEHPSPKVDMTYWKANHGKEVGAGKVSEESCLNCHQPEKFCNKCHAYVGVRLIEAEGAAPAAPAKEEAPEAQQPQPPAAEAEAKPALHGEGRCDQCHDAPTMEDMRTGLHKQAFEKFEGHKNFCQECHNVEKTCTQCHALPAVMQ